MPDKDKEKKQERKRERDRQRYRQRQKEVGFLDRIVDRQRQRRANDPVYAAKCRLWERNYRLRKKLTISPVELEIIREKKRLDQVRRRLGDSSYLESERKKARDRRSSPVHRERILVASRDSRRRLLLNNTGALERERERGRKKESRKRLEIQQTGFISFATKLQQWATS